MVDGLGPEQGGWGMAYERVVDTFDNALVELKGILSDGEIVLMPSAEWEVSRCGRATDVNFLEGDWRHPPGNAPLDRKKYLYNARVLETPAGPIANFTILAPIELSNALRRQRERDNWPMPTPLEPDAYGICFRATGQNAFEPQLGQRRFIVADAGSPPLVQMRVVQLAPDVVFPAISAEVRLAYGPSGPSPTDPPLAGPGDLVAIRNADVIAASNCSGVHVDETQLISPNHTIRTGPLFLNQLYHLCVANVSEVGAQPPAGSGGVWRTGFAWQRIVTISVATTLNAGSGIYTNQGLALRATTPGMPPATLSQVIFMEPTGLPTRLELIGPIADAVEVRGIPFSTAPFARVTGVHGEAYADVTGLVTLEAFGSCSPTLEGTTSVELVEGVATFPDVFIADVECLGQPVALRAEVSPTVGTARFLQLQPVATSPFRIASGAAYRVDVVDTAVAIERDDDAECIQVFKLGEASVSAVVKDAQGSPVVDYALPVDIRLCDPPLSLGGTPRCPSASAMLVGTVQVAPVEGVVTFNNFSVTNISSGYVLALYTPMLQVDYTQPFAACDAGVPQELFFARQPPSEAVATLPFAPQPIVLVRDGFGRIVKTIPSGRMHVTLRVVPENAEEGAADGGAIEDLSIAAQLSGDATVRTAFSDPLGLDEWNTTTFHAQHALFSGLTVGTAGRWRLHASSPTLRRTVTSEVVVVLPGEIVSLRFDPVDVEPLRVAVGEPVAPPLVVRLFDALGNNVTHENASALVQLHMEPSAGLNGGELLGNASAAADHGIALFDNLQFNEAGTLKRLIASSPGLANATVPLLQVLPGSPTQLFIRRQPSRIVGLTDLPAAVANDRESATAAAAAAALPVGNVLAEQTIHVAVSLLDSMGNDACSNLTAVEDCPVAAQQVGAAVPPSVYPIRLPLPPSISLLALPQLPLASPGLLLASLDLCFVSLAPLTASSPDLARAAAARDRADLAVDRRGQLHDDALRRGHAHRLAASRLPQRHPRRHF